MSQVLILGDGPRQARAIALSNWIAVGSNLATPATISIYDGLAPLSPQDPVGSQNLLAQIEGAVPFVSSVVNGVITLGTTAAAPGLNPGTATWARIARGDNEVAFDATVGLTGSGSVIELASVDILPGILVSITSGIITEA